MKSPFKFKKYGESGMDVSELWPHLSEHVDDIALIRSMSALSPAHGPALFQMNTGTILAGAPSVVEDADEQVDPPLVPPDVAARVNYALGPDAFAFAGRMTHSVGGTFGAGAAAGVAARLRRARRRGELYRVPLRRQFGRQILL